jgi:FkbM family methyltransferase
MSGLSHILYINPYTQHEIGQLSLGAPTIQTTIRPQYAQCGEDLILAAMLDVIGMRKGAKLSELRYVEIGANHPVATSSTYLLYRHHGARGVLVEANPRLIPELERARAGDQVLNFAVVPSDVESIDITISSATELSSVDPRFPAAFKQGAYPIEGTARVPAIQINKLFAQCWGQPRLSFLSIDVEGLDFDLLCSLDLQRFPVDMIQIEPSDAFIPGNSLRMCAHMRAAGYALVARTDVNLLFARHSSLDPVL